MSKAESLTPKSEGNPRSERGAPKFARGSHPALQCLGLCPTRGPFQGRFANSTASSKFGLGNSFGFRHSGFGFQRRLYAALLFVTALAANAAEVPPLKICLLSACAEYQSDKSLSEFQAYLEAHYRVLCQRVSGKDKGDDLPGLEALDNSDLMILFTRRVKLPADQLERIKKYLASRRPIVGIRTASHAFENYLELDREVLGGDYKGHHGDDEGEVRIAAGQTNHPVLAGVLPFKTRRLYKNAAPAADVTILLNGFTPDYHEPIAWVRQRDGRRVFYTSMGTPEDFAQENFRRLLVNAIFWATKRDEAATRRP